MGDTSSNTLHTLLHCLHKKLMFILRLCVRVCVCVLEYNECVESCYQVLGMEIPLSSIFSIISQGKQEES